MVGQGEGKPVSYRHACIFLTSQSSLPSFKIPIPETALEGDPSEAPADKKLHVPHPRGMKELSRPPAAQGTHGAGGAAAGLREQSPARIHQHSLVTGVQPGQVRTHTWLPSRQVRCPSTPGCPPPAPTAGKGEGRSE